MERGRRRCLGVRESKFFLVPISAATINWKTGIFSATVAAFIIESYKKLSLDSGDQTVFLLGQVSRQLSGLANGTFIQPQQYPSSPPSVSVICVNVVWLLSLVLSTTSALLATLTQQWARRYVQLPQIPSVQSERARVRSFLFLGTRKYAMHHAVEMAPTLLHLSVFLFNVGLVIFFFTIFKVVAIILLVIIGIFGMAYFILTILPCLDHDCPYRTPMSSIFWYFWHTIALLSAFFSQRVLKHLHAVLVPPNLGVVTGYTQRKLVQWLDYVEDSFNRHWKCLRDGFRESIIRRALDAPLAVDIKALTWLFQLPALAEKSKIQTFVAGIPGETIVQLFSDPSKRGKITLRDHLFTLLRSCAPGTVGLEEDKRRHRLLDCLNAIHHVVKASIVPYSVSPSEPVRVLNDVRTNFANVGLMRALWDDLDPSIRITARSICALLARHFLRQYPPEESELAWLHEVIGLPSHVIYNQFRDTPALDNMNIDAFVYGVLSNQTDDLPITQAISFAETLVILMRAGSQTSLRRDTFREQLSFLISRVENGGHQHRDNVAEKLRKIFHGFLSDSGTAP